MVRYQYVIRRVLLAVIVLLGVTMLTFYLTRGLSGINPVILYASPETPVSQHEQIIKRYGLDQPLLTQYGYYLKNLFQGDLGFSRTSGAPTLEVILKLLPATIELALMAFLIAIVIGIPLGLYAAIRHGTKREKFIKSFSLIFVSLPAFWIGLMLQLVFFFWLQKQGFFHFPSTGRGPTVYDGAPLGNITGFYLFDAIITANFSGFLVSLKHLILPALTMALFPMGLIIRVVRSSTLDVLEEDYIDYAKSKGMNEFSLLIRHVLKNALIPVLTVMGLVVGRLMAGSVIVESVFSWPGIGSWAAKSILSNDLSAIMGFTLVIAIFFVIINLIVDVCYSYLDPRIKY